MSTQQASSIDFSIAEDLTNFQLVELPDELVTLIANHKAEVPVLQLKSEAQIGNAVLCSPNTTFPLRSVQTSNSLFVVQPTGVPGQDEDMVPTHGIRAISLCGVTLELSKSTESPLPYLRKALPVYTSRDLNAAAAVKSTFDDICRDVPLSDGEIQEGWTALCVFEQQGASFRPTANILLELWAAISTAATADDINLTAAFLVEDLWISIRDQDFPRGLFNSILKRVEDRDTMDPDADTKWCTLDKTRCSEWIATLVLETRTVGDQTMAVSDFMDAWRNSILEHWRSDTSLDLILNFVNRPSSTTIALKPERRLAGPPASITDVSETKASTKVRKWHDKFKKSRT